MKFLICVIALAGLGAIRCDVWQYPELQPNGILLEAEDWGGTCAAGRRQSPVDLNENASVRGEYNPFKFVKYGHRATQSYSILNNGHSIQVLNNNIGEISIKGGGLGDTYIFQQMHFHWASEHTIRDQHYGLELHLVHYQQKFDSLAKAAQAKNGIAVLAVLFHISEHDNHNIEKLLHHAEPLMSEPEVLAHYSDELMLDDFMPNDRSKYYRYEGSLTTPGCAEDVIWTVFSESLHISLGQVERFKLVKTESGRELTHNFRSTQPFNGRTLVYVSPQQNDDISYEQ